MHLDGRRVREEMETRRQVEKRPRALVREKTSRLHDEADWSLLFDEDTIYPRPEYPALLVHEVQVAALAIEYRVSADPNSGKGELATWPQHEVAAAGVDDQVAAGGRFGAQGAGWCHGSLFIGDHRVARTVSTGVGEPVEQNPTCGAVRPVVQRLGLQRPCGAARIKQPQVRRVLHQPLRPGHATTDRLATTLPGAIAVRGQAAQDDAGALAGFRAGCGSHRRGSFRCSSLRRDASSRPPARPHPKTSGIDCSPRRRIGVSESQVPALREGDPTSPVPDGKPNLVVFSDDWGRHPSSCQHLVRALLDKYRVCWVNTIGTRIPRLDAYSLARGAEKIWTWMASRSPAAARDGNPLVLVPVMWPSYGSALGRRINRWAIGRAVGSAVGGGANGVCVTTLPIAAGLVGRLPVERWIYYCVDDLAQWPGLDRSSLERLERELVSKVDEIVAVSEHLVERMASLGRQASLLTHGVDLEHWTAGPQTAPSLDLVPVEEPLVVFWGVVDRRLDVEMLQRLGSELGGGTIALLGPPNNPDPVVDSIPGLQRVGPVPYDDLPAWARRAAVLIMPYADLPATRAIQPLKLKEYLATGRAVVCSRLPAVGEWEDACDVVESPGDFAARVVRAGRRRGCPPAQRTCRERLADEELAGQGADFREGFSQVRRSDLRWSSDFFLLLDPPCARRERHRRWAGQDDSQFATLSRPPGLSGSVCVIHAGSGRPACSPSSRRAPVQLAGAASVPIDDRGALDVPGGRPPAGGLPIAIDRPSGTATTTRATYSAWG